MFGIDDAVTAVAGIGGKLIDRLWPDPVAAAAAKVELLKMQQSGELAQLTADTDLMKGQLAVNQVEAANTNLFVAGWRPFIGWICGMALLWAFFLGPLLTWATGWPIPALDVSSLLVLLNGILGLAGMRTYEKTKGLKPGM